MNKKKQRLLKEIKECSPFNSLEELLEKIMWWVDSHRLLSVADQHDIVYYIDELIKLKDEIKFEEEPWHDETGLM
jgi:hypothetical protein